MVAITKNNFVGKNRKGLAIDVVDYGRAEERPDDPPAQALDGSTGPGSRGGESHYQLSLVSRGLLEISMSVT